MHEIRTVVAIKFQRVWRKYYRNVVKPRKQRESEMAVAHVVQKALRGYLGRKKILMDRRQQVMNKHFEYFEQMKN